jgi:DNA-binding protein YbaB
VTTVSETADRDANQALRDRLTDVYGRYERLRSEMDGLQRRLASLQVSAVSDDGLTKATVDSRGHLVDLHLDRSAYGSVDADELAQTIVATVRSAAAHTAGRVEELMSGYLPPDSGALQFLRDNDFDSLMRRPDVIARHE